MENLDRGTTPQPCKRFHDANVLDWMAKLIEETNEAVQEARIVSKRIETRKKNLAEELTDVITVCVSWLDALGYNAEMRGELQRKVNEKNRKRGYF